ncbi:immunity 49 family protein [Nocardia sp. CDC160]|uniref:immunity 49 family protein n=1 Tax=Nocardia sp. CDC160 TaxID=3112166 RepID=UPI002DBF2526|nr:immunity 49 family protein [Nocardia sp. CDC160]MEC3916127.1 immunity 49 family protein [Nocardia sp. CDC160]
MIEIPRHAIDPRSIREVDEGSVAAVVGRVRVPPRPEGPNFSRSMDGTLLARMLMADPAALRSRTWYFARSTERTITRRFRASGIEYGFDRHDRVAGWRAAFWWTLIARDAEAMRELIEYPVDRLREYGDGAFDDFQYEWVRLLQSAWRFGPRSVAEAAWGLDTRSRVGAQRVTDLLLRPAIEVFVRLAEGDSDGFDRQLAQALRSHREFFDTATWGHDPEGVFSLPLLALSCWARDLGYRTAVRSEYLPAGFIDRPDWMYSPELADELNRIESAKARLTSSTSDL